MKKILLGAVLATLATAVTAEVKSVTLVRTIQDEMLVTYEEQMPFRQFVTLIKYSWFGTTIDGEEIYFRRRFFKMTCGEPTVEMFSEERISMKSVEVLNTEQSPPINVAIAPDPELRLATEFMCGSREPPVLPAYPDKNPKDERVLECRFHTDTKRTMQLSLNEPASQVNNLRAIFSKSTIKFISYTDELKPAARGVLDRFTGNLMMTILPIGESLFGKCVVVKNAKF